mmetsp:Transcript_34621/g.67368  ORF Transcript_34621/g.67368 Transcript_34621/m.67368 type:complete len:299 (-) Transcript_34621:142-1038(-)
MPPPSAPPYVYAQNGGDSIQDQSQLGGDARAPCQESPSTNDPDSNEVRFQFSGYIAIQNQDDGLVVQRQRPSRECPCLSERKNGETCFERCRTRSCCCFTWTVVLSVLALAVALPVYFLKDQFGRDSGPATVHCNFTMNSKVLDVYFNGDSILSDVAGDLSDWRSTKHFTVNGVGDKSVLAIKGHGPTSSGGGNDCSDTEAMLSLVCYSSDSSSWDRVRSDSLWESYSSSQSGDPSSSWMKYDGERDGFEYSCLALNSPASCRECRRRGPRDIDIKLSKIWAESSESYGWFVQTVASK